MVLIVGVSDYKLISTIKNFFGKLSSYKRKFLNKWKVDLRIFPFIFIDKKIKNYLKIFNYKEEEEKFSLRFLINKNYARKICEKTKQKNLFLFKCNLIKYKKKKINFCVPKKTCSSLELHHNIKFNQISLIRKEKRIEIDNLIRKEIIRIDRLKNQKNKDLWNSLKNKNCRPNNVKNNNNLYSSKKLFNRKIIKNVNQILKTLNEIFI